MNFQELAQKIRRIDEGAVVECGDMMPGHMPMPQQMPQQDTVSMNVSMNATGKGGIRDLMQVLQNIENNVTGGHSEPVIDIGPDDMHIDAEPNSVDSMMGGEVELEPEFDAEPEHGEEEIVFGTDEPETEFDVEPEHGGKGIDPKIKHAIAPVVQAVGLAHALGQDPSKALGDKVTDETDMAPGEPVSTQPTDMGTGEDEQLASEEFANRPNARYQSQNFMTKTLAQGADEPQRMTKHGYRNGDNPLAMKEGLVGDLANLYQEVKLREGKEKTMSRAAKGVMKYGKKGMQALAKAGKEGKDLEPIQDKYNKYKD